MNLKHFFPSAVLFFAFSVVHGQETITPLRSNPTIINYLKAHPESEASRVSKKKDGPLKLPFFDDFSNNGIYPEQELWYGRDVFINSTFPIEPPSYGVATFDGLDETGFPYNIDGANTPRICDDLTSHEIDLSEFSNEDSIYLSFYYQQKGLGETPEVNDSLILEFKRADGEWYNAWSISGIRIIEGDPAFQQVMVNVSDAEDESYVLLHDSFQFRFRNMGNPTGALDHWHLDYVFLNDNRTATDSLNPDISIYRRPNGLFKNYYSMPWRHFREDPRAFQNENIDYHVNNRSGNLLSPNIFYTIKDITNDEELYSSFDLRNQIVDINPLSTKTGDQPNELPFFHFDNLEDQRVQLEIKMVVSDNSITAIDQKQRSNDTFTFYQRFDEYLSYDDGSAEGGYGLANSRQGAVALKFATRTVDTLKYVAFSFTGGFEVLPDQKKFNIIIWQQLTPSPVILSRIDGVRTMYSYRKDGFVLYELEEPLVVSGEFLIGWEQFSAFNLNVGIDLNYRYFNDDRPNPNLFINLGSWENSKVVGTPLIRPVFSSDTYLSTNDMTKDDIRIDAYPNPVTDQLQVAIGNNDVQTLSLFSLQGQEVYRVSEPSGNVQIDMTQLHPGLYLLMVETRSGRRVQQKIIKN